MKSNKKVPKIEQLQKLLATNRAGLGQLQKAIAGALKAKEEAKEKLAGLLINEEVLYERIWALEDKIAAEAKKAAKPARAKARAKKGVKR